MLAESGQYQKIIVKHLKNRNGVASPCRTTCTVCGDAPCYAFLSIQLYLATLARFAVFNIPSAARSLPGSIPGIGIRR